MSLGGLLLLLTGRLPAGLLDEVHPLLRNLPLGIFLLLGGLFSGAHSGRPFLAGLFLYGTGIIGLWWLTNPLASGSAQLIGALPALLVFLPLAWWMKKEGASFGLRGDHRRGLMLLAPPTLLGLVILFQLGSGKGSWEEFLSYPLWALLQLLFFLPPLLFLSARAGESRAFLPLAAFCFALIHAPNPWLMLATGSGMLLWAFSFQRHRSLVACAISMGVLAVGLAQTPPEASMAAMKVGPGFASYRHSAALESQYLDFIERWAGDPAGDRPDPREWLTLSREDVLGVPLSADNLDSLARSMLYEQRCAFARLMLASEEYAKRHGVKAIGRPRVGFMAPDLESLPERFQQPQPWCDREWQAQFSGHRKLVASLYAGILERGASPAELGSWPAGLSREARETLIHGWFLRQAVPPVPGWLWEFGSLEERLARQERSPSKD